MRAAYCIQWNGSFAQGTFLFFLPATCNFIAQIFFLTIYFISGLGADERIFERLVLPSWIQVRHLRWIEPLRKESLAAYCRRLAAPIGQQEDFVLAGLSFGGMAAIEISKFLQPRLVILLSSVATRHELPFPTRLVRWLRLHLITPVFIMKWPKFFLYWIFSARTAREKELLRDFTRRVSGRYLKWSINEVVNWKNEERPAMLFHLHGKADRIFPYALTHADAPIEHGGHLIVHDRAAEVSALLAERLEQLAGEDG